MIGVRAKYNTWLYLANSILCITISQYSNNLIYSLHQISLKSFIKSYIMWMVCIAVFSSGYDNKIWYSCDSLNLVKSKIVINWIGKSVKLI